MKPAHPTRRQLLLLGLAGGLGTLGPAPLRAHEYSARNFMLMHPWADPSPQGATEARVFFTIESVEEADTLLGAYCDFAEITELRGSTDNEAPALDSVPVPVGRFVDFSPGHPHVLLRGLKQRLLFGRSYLVTLAFEKAGRLPVQVSIGPH